MKQGSFYHQCNHTWCLNLWWHCSTTTLEFICCSRPNITQPSWWAKWLELWGSGGANPAAEAVAQPINTANVSVITATLNKLQIRWFSKQMFHLTWIIRQQCHGKPHWVDWLYLKKKVRKWYWVYYGTWAQCILKVHGRGITQCIQVTFHYEMDTIK